MISKEIKNLIIKYLSNSATTEELETLNIWIKKSNNSSKFKSFVKTHYLINYNLNDDCANNIKKKLLAQIRKEKSQRSLFTIKTIYKYAAIAVLFLSVGYFYQNFFATPSGEVTPKEEFVILETEDGSKKVISEDGTIKILDTDGNVVGNQNGNQLVYGSDNSLESIEYHTLNVPYGKRFQLLLSDGTNVHLNAGTTLKYPVQFIEGQQRKVYLSGEAYFDVRRNEASPFIVNSDELNVEVLGTQFNVSSYPEDSSSEVVLVEGSVNLFTGDASTTSTNQVLLEPGFVGALDKNSNNIVTREVVTSIYTSWIHGELVFRNMTFSNILKKMERHYNVEIENRNLELSNEKFNASFGDEPISKILKYFETYNVEFSIDEHKIIIN